MIVQPDICVVVPLYNEGPNVLPLCQSLLRALASQPGSFEILLVDDGSTDETWTRIQEAQRTHARIRSVRHGEKLGQSAALWTGFAASTSPVIGTLDGDLQNDPADLPQMLRELASCDMVCGVRGQRRDGWLRRISSRIARGARKLVLRVDFRDTGCNQRVFRRSVLALIPSFDGVHRFMPVLAHHFGAKVREIAVTHHPRRAGYSKYGIRNRLLRGIRDLVKVRRIMRSPVGQRVPGTSTAPPAKAAIAK